MNSASPLRCRRSVLARSLAGVLICLSGCNNGTQNGPLVQAYLPHTPFLSGAPNAQECKGTFFVTSLNGTPSYPISIDLTQTAFAGLAISDSAGGTVPVYNGPGGPTAPIASEVYTISATPDTTNPIQYDIVSIYPKNPSTSATPPVQLSTYTISETDRDGDVSAPLTITVQWGQNPPSGCWLAPNQPAPTNLSVASGSDGDFLLQFSSPMWRTGGNQNSCSSPDTFDVEISTDSTFRAVAWQLTLASGPQPAGSTNTSTVGGTTLQQFNAGGQWNFSCQYGRDSGNLQPSLDPLPLSFGAVQAPDVTYTSAGGANPLFFRVRGEYYGAVGPWSQSVTFQVPAPTQNFNSGTDKCSAGPVTFPCIPWNFQANVANWDMQVARPGVTLGNNSAGPFLMSGSFDTSPGQQACCGNFSPGSGPGVNQYCGPANVFNFAPYCAAQPGQLNPTGGAFIWDIRAHYTAGHIGPWSVPFAGTWPGSTAVPNVVNQLVSNAITAIQNAGFTFVTPSGPCACANVGGVSPCGGGASGPNNQLRVTLQCPAAGSPATPGSGVALAWVANGGGPGGSTYASMNFVNQTSNSATGVTLYYLSANQAWTKIVDLASGNSYTFSLTSGTTYIVEGVADSGTSHNGDACAGQSPDVLNNNGDNDCIIFNVLGTATAISGPSGTLTLQITGGAP